MRTLIWSSTALVLLAVGGVFMAANYAARNPDSFVGRCATTVYHLWAPLAQSCAPKEAAPVAQTAPAPAPAGLTPAGTLTPALEVVEPIAVDPTEEEPPLAFPRLSPEVAAALERLRVEEENEAPQQPFDGAGQTLRMPYADEEVEVLPYPTRDAETSKDATEELLQGFIDVSNATEAGAKSGAERVRIDSIETTTMFFLPPSWWQAVCEKVMESVRLMRDAQRGNEEPADQGTPDEDDNGGLQQIPYEHYHAHGCPYTGCPYPYYRPVMPVAPAGPPAGQRK